MGQFASGVTVVTMRDGDQPVGITVSSFASLSLDPPLVLVCIDNRGRSHDALARADMFAVNILSEDQEATARTFASRTVDKFANADWRWSSNGIPTLDGVLATVECRIANALPGGDHTIFVGEVVALETQAGRPLVYHASQFGQFVASPKPEERPFVRPTVRTPELAVA
jgi:flavin reductase (DIM6/NTAB) family NADH-FMN oxidoreductase RutF